MGAERGDRETWGRLPPAPGKGGLGLRGQGAWEEGVPREGEVAVGREARGWRDLGRRWPGGGLRGHWEQYGWGGARASGAHLVHVVPSAETGNLEAAGNGAGAHH